MKDTAALQEAKEHPDYFQFWEQSKVPINYKRVALLKQHIGSGTLFYHVFDDFSDWEKL